ncbi:PEP-CTERM sorting domain-containing protein [Pelomonas sp. KK5]|uniref:PEP-CTERM sorting domain-containing protein n=1 Tax=Pelomonas sp. KK5 TaxID=1855730 RepID=UPI00117D7257|nr:PEP-CTERM sorting domain-containing protein [Pelomonas sp. KK5]
MRLNKLLLALTLLGSASVFAAPSYTIVDLGPLAGDASSNAYNISAGGLITGRSYGSASSTAILASAGGGVSGLGGLSGRNYAWSYGANAGGTVVGAAASTLVGSGALPVAWQGGAATQLALPAGTTGGTAYDVNASNLIVGQASGATPQAAIFGTGGSSLVPTLSGGTTMAIAYAVNDSGLAVGYGTSAATGSARIGVVYDTASGAATLLGALPGKNGSIAYDISNSGYVVGASVQNTSQTGLPFIWTAAGGMQAIPLLNGATTGTARGVNDSGWVVGTVGVGNTTPYVYDGTNVYDLGTLVGSAPGWSMTSSFTQVMGISGSGIIAGTAVYNGAAHAFALMPTAVPEPGSWALMLGGLALVAAVGARRGRRQAG